MAEPRTKRAPKKEKDPDQPKRPLSAFMLFTNEKRDQVKADHPDIKFTEVGKKLGEMWGKLSDAEKEPYQNEYKKKKAVYDKEIEAYNKRKGVTPKKSRAKKAAADDDDEE
ncbi:putative high-mobility group non-histone chromosomal protein [Ramicandelaber brevisporus]|nr:putative high-mobility group non-histone chromosomal protein [Ramicandelaber brevisporus]